jgi:hypothetical protein
LTFQEPECCESIESGTISPRILRSRFWFINLCSRIAHCRSLTRTCTLWCWSRTLRTIIEQVVTTWISPLPSNMGRACHNFIAVHWFDASFASVISSGNQSWQWKIP